MQSTRVKVAAVLVVYLAVAAILFAPLIRVQKVDRKRMASLIVATPPAGFTKRPAAANPVTNASNPFPEIKAAAKTAPNSTGSYSVEWSMPQTNDAADLIVSILPSKSDAAKVQQQAKSIYASSSSLKSAGYSYAGAVAVPSVPGASGAFFAPSTLTNPPIDVIVFQQGRAQVTEFLGISGAKADIEATSAAFARSEYVHLQSALTGFSLTKTSWPVVSTVIYWAVVVFIAGVAVSIPGIRRRARHRRDLAAERARTQHKTVRGSKIVKRQAGRRVPK